MNTLINLSKLNKVENSIILIDDIVTKKVKYTRFANIINKLRNLSKLNKVGIAIVLTVHLPLIISLVIAVIEQTKLNNL